MWEEGLVEGFDEVEEGDRGRVPAQYWKQPGAPPPASDPVGAKEALVLATNVFEDDTVEEGLLDEEARGHHARLGERKEDGHDRNHHLDHRRGKGEDEWRREHSETRR